MNLKLILCLALVLGGNCFAAIVYPKAPEGGRKMVFEHADETLRSDPPFLEGFRIEELAIADPCQCYNVGLKELAAGHLLSAAKSGGSWRYLLIHGTNAVGAAELIADETTGKALKFTSLSAPSAAPLNALRIADQLPQVKKQDFEVRYLSMAPILFSAVWLHGKSDDIIIPLPETFGRWNAYQPYSESEMLKLLKPVVKKKLKEPPGMLD